MRKLIILVLVLVSVTLFSNEILFDVSTTEFDLNAEWNVGYLGLNWEKEGDYQLDFNITQLLNGGDIIINEAWKKLELKYFDLTFGNMLYDFGYNYAKPSQLLTIFNPGYIGGEWMVKIDKTIKDYKTYLYFTDIVDEVYNFGFGFKDTFGPIDWALDFKLDGYGTDPDVSTGNMSTNAKYVNKDFTLVGILYYMNFTNEDYTTDYGMLASYKLDKFIPYFGYFTRDNSEESDMLFGAKIIAFEDLLFKAEYKIDSAIEDAQISLQLGFTF